MRGQAEKQENGNMGERPTGRKHPYRPPRSEGDGSHDGGQRKKPDLLKNENGFLTSGAGRKTRLRPDIEHPVGEAPLPPNGTPPQEKQKGKQNPASPPQKGRGHQEGEGANRDKLEIWNHLLTAAKKRFDRRLRHDVGSGPPAKEGI